jgi:hypothetical protein
MVLDMVGSLVMGDVKRIDEEEEEHAGGDTQQICSRKLLQLPVGNTSSEEMNRHQTVMKNAMNNPRSMFVGR